MHTPIRRPGRPRKPSNLGELFLAELARQPLNASDLATKFNTNRSKSNKTLAELAAAGRVHKQGGSSDIKWHPGPAPVGYVHKPTPKAQEAKQTRQAEATRNAWGPSPWMGQGPNGFTEAMARRFESPTSADANTSAILRAPSGISGVAAELDE
jgi:hypothetical protein